MKLLRSPWLYVALGLLTALVYLRLFHHHHGLSSMQSSTATTQTVESSPELDVQRIMRTLHERPVLGVMLMGWILIGAGLVIGGLVIGLRAMLARRVRAAFDYPSRLSYLWRLSDAVRVILLLAFAVLLLPFVQLGLTRLHVQLLDDAHTWTVTGMLLLHSLLFLFVWAFAVDRTGSARQAFGLTPSVAGSALRQAFVEYVAVFPWVFALLALVAGVCEHFGIQPPSEPIQELVFGEPRAAVVAMTVVLACVVGPIAEEVLFRGVLFTALRRHTPRRWAMLISGALFAALHANIFGFLPMMVIGCLLADVYERTGSLLAPVAVHMAHNAFLIGFALTVKALG